MTDATDDIHKILCRISPSAVRWSERDLRHLADEIYRRDVEQRVEIELRSLPEAKLQEAIDLATGLLLHRSGYRLCPCNQTEDIRQWSMDFRLMVLSCAREIQAQFKIREAPNGAPRKGTRHRR